MLIDDILDKDKIDEIKERVFRCAATNLDADFLLAQLELLVLAGIERPSAARDEPVPMILFCPAPGCGVQHIDRPEPAAGWNNPPHKSHLCAECGHVWRPASVFTTGVETVPPGASDTTPVIRGVMAGCVDQDRIIAQEVAASRRVLASAIYKFAPDLALKLLDQWHRIPSEGQKALDTMLSLLQQSNARDGG